MATIDAIDITKLLFQEGSAPSTPASTKWYIYAKTTGLFYKDDAGVETGPLGAATGTFNQDTMLPWHVNLIPMVTTSDATTGTWILQGYTDASMTFPFFQPGTSAANAEAAVGFTNSSSAVNDAIAWDVILSAGTWDAHFWVRKSTNTGIITLNQDGSSAGTVDTYAAAAAAAKVSITGWTVSATGKKRMQLKMATKNASSSNYVLNIFALEFRRTA